MTGPCPFRYFKISPEIIRLALMLYVRYPLTLRSVEDLLHERGCSQSSAPSPAGIIQKPAALPHAGDAVCTG